jgi:hypothetical protein
MFQVAILMGRFIAPTGPARKRQDRCSTHRVRHTPQVLSEMTVGPLAQRRKA